MSDKRKADTLAQGWGSFTNRLKQRREAIESGQPEKARKPFVKKDKKR